MNDQSSQRLQRRAKKFGRQRGPSYRRGERTYAHKLKSPSERLVSIERASSRRSNNTRKQRQGALKSSASDRSHHQNAPHLQARPHLQVKPRQRTGNNGAKPFTNASDNGRNGASGGPVVMKPGLRLIPLGGLEEIGRNMMVIEYGNEIIIVDMGLQFPEEDMPGIDYIVPNIEYLLPRAKYIRGVVITHGHYDHIGAIPHFMGPLGNPPIYTSALTRGIILKRMDDFPNAPKLNVHTVKANETIQMGKSFKVEFLHINHNIPDSFALAIHTPEGTLVHTGDFKFDPNPINEEPADLSALERIGKAGVLALTSDSTDVEEPGVSIPEAEIRSNMEEIFQENGNSRIIFATFSSLLSRVQQVFDLSYKYGRKVAVEGYSMRNNVEIARGLGYLKTARDVQISARDIDKYKPQQVAVLCTGAQGEGNAVLMRIAQREHPFIRIQKDDVVVFSSSVIPGNERSVQGLKDVLYRQGAKVIHYKMMDIHAGGHAHQEDLAKMINLTKPRYFFPVHGNYYMLKLHSQLAVKNGIRPEDTFIMNNGDCAHVSKEHVNIERGVAPTNYIFVDGLGVGDIGEIVLRDRQKMAEEGMFVVIASIDSKTGKIRDKIDIISRGFVYMNESKELMAAARDRVRSIVERNASKEYSTNWSYLKNNIRDDLGELLYQKTRRRPLILPVVMEV